jgi:Holliday junction resolvasome RuvABC ATP-dependent DNA helicase subunit
MSSNNFPNYYNMNPNNYIQYNQPYNTYYNPYYNPYGSMIPVYSYQSPIAPQQHMMPLNNATYCPDCVEKTYMQQNPYQAYSNNYKKKGRYNYESNKRKNNKYYIKPTLNVDKPPSNVVKPPSNVVKPPLNVNKPPSSNKFSKLELIKPKKLSSNSNDKSINKAPIESTFVLTTTGPNGGNTPPSLFSGIMNMLIGGSSGDDDDSNPFNLFATLKKDEKDEEIDVENQTEEEEDLSDCEFKHAGPIKSLDDLIKLGNDYKNTEVKYRYNINMKKLSKMVDALQELNSLIGMKKIKKAIFNKIIFYLQELEDNKDMLHMAIQGSPGVGKTCIIGILAKIYKALGFLSKGHIVKVKRDDFVAGFLGQTSIKTRKLLEKAKGGILVIDEAYSLGNEELRDSYSKEAIDMLTAYLSEEADDMICIIAGYEHQLDKCFFAYNEGLNRRFTRYTIDEYSPEDLRKIYIKIVKENKWDFIKDNAKDIEERNKNIKDINTKIKKIEKENESLNIKQLNQNLDELKNKLKTQTNEDVEYDSLFNTVTQVKEELLSIKKIKKANEILISDLKEKLKLIIDDEYTTSVPLKFFENNKKYFTFNGGDMLTLFTMCKNSHSKRLLEIKNETELLGSRKKINNDDIESGFELFLLNPEVKKRGETMNDHQMYT